jgi:hypothetical protein
MTDAERSQLIDVILVICGDATPDRVTDKIRSLKDAAVLESVQYEYSHREIL